MSRRTWDAFAEPLGLVYIAGTTREAEAAESALNGAGIDYAVELEEYRNDSILGSLFGGTYTGLFFHVPVAQHTAAKELLEAEGLRDTVGLHEDEEPEREHGT